jgi:AcrR family transcriptional regulator
VVVLAQLEQQVQLLGEQSVVVAEVSTEDAEGFGKRATADGDLGAATTDQVDGGEVLVDPYRIQDGQKRPAGGGIGLDVAEGNNTKFHGSCQGEDGRDGGVHPCDGTKWSGHSDYRNDNRVTGVPVPVPGRLGPVPEMSRPSQPCERALRADAERNRGRIIAAARAVFAEQGLDASMNEVARQAGVGVATLFRRFPTRDDLITATFADKMSAYADAITDALADPDPWHGFCAYVERVCAMQAQDRGFTDVLTVTFPAAKGFEAERDRAAAGFAELIGRAKATGQLRQDFVHQDLVLLLMANAGVVAGTREAAPEAWRRLVAYLLQAFTTAAAEPLPAPPTAHAVPGPDAASAQPRLAAATSSRD